ncbi:MAG: hypothetical protein ACE15F_15345 [bacterium]
MFLLMLMTLRLLNHSQRDLEWLMDYEITCSSRYRRFFTLILFTSTDTRHGVDPLVMGKIIRECDRLFVFQHYGALLMSETDAACAVKAIHRFLAAFLHQENLRFAVASYPRDGHTAADLIGLAQGRLERARRLNQQVIMSGGY